MKAQSPLWLWQFGSYLRYGMLSRCICSTLVFVCAMKGIPIGSLTQWGKDLTYILSHSFLLSSKLRYVLPWQCMSMDGSASGQNALHTYILYCNNKTIFILFGRLLLRLYLKYRKQFQIILKMFYRARWLRDNARDSHSGGSGFKSRCRPTWMSFFVVFLYHQGKCWVAFSLPRSIWPLFIKFIYHKINSVNLTNETLTTQQ